MCDFLTCRRIAPPTIAALLLMTALLAPRGARAENEPFAGARDSTSEPIDAEVVLDEYDVQDRVVAQGFERSISEHRIIRVLTAAGAASQGTMSIPYTEGTKLEELVVICTSPDGRKTHVQPETMFDRVRLQLGNEQLRERTFPLPGVVPGSRIEYRLLETVSSPDHLLPLWLTCQRDIPVREIRLSVRPWPQSTFVLRTNAGSGHSSPVTRDASGKLRMTIRDVSAYRAEALMPPEVESRLSIYGTYLSGEQSGASWKLESDGGEMHRRYGAMRSYTDSATTIAKRVAAEISDPEERARRLYRFCREALRNPESGPDSGRVTATRVTHSDEVLLSAFQRHIASPYVINLAFAALAESAGLDIHLAWGIAPAHAAFDSSFATFGGFSFVVVMLKHDGGWWYCFPGDYWLPFGSMPAEIEGAPVVFTGGPRAVLGRLPRKPAGESAIERQWNVELAADGTLAGFVRQRATGHMAVALRERLRHRPATKALELVRDLMERHPSAEVGSVAMNDTAGADEPLEASFHIRIPDFAQPAGGSLLAPAVPFEADPMPGLWDSRREHPICLPYAWVASDEVRMRLPEGAVVAPADHRIDTAFAGLGKGEFEVRAGPDQREARFTRRLEFGTDGVIRLAPEQYSRLRASLEGIRQVSRAQLTVRLAPGGRR